MKDAQRKRAPAALAAVLLGAVTAGFPASRATVVEEPYRWGLVAIGGGGYVTGMVIHPCEDNLVYIRTDVGGAYRWEEKGARWIPITDWIPIAEANLYGIESIAIDPSDPDVVYLAAGQSEGASPSDVLKSIDRGRSFVRTRLDRRMDGNGGGPGRSRIMGERLMVDPNQGSTVYFGSRFEGLWRTTDGARTWHQVSFPSAGVPPEGLPFVLFHQAASQAGTPTRTLYAAAYGVGVYRSLDAGSSWALLDGGPREPTRGAVAADGALYVGHKSGVARFADGSWTDISPSAEWYCGLSVHPTDSNIVLTARSERRHQEPVYISRDRGARWSQVAYSLNNTVPWWPMPQYFSSATASLSIDLRFPSRVWLTDWFGIWRTDDITATPSIWTNHQSGHEEVVSTGTLISPPSGPVLLHTGVADNGGYDHESLSEYPRQSIRAKGLGEGFTSTGIDFQEANPAFLVRVGRHHWDGAGLGGYSTDGGRSYARFAVVPGAGGRVAVSANSERIVWATQSGGVYVSRDRGGSWIAASGAPEGAVEGPSVFVDACPLASDRVDGSTFYLFKGGIFYRSSDGGLQWASTADRLPEARSSIPVDFANVAAGPRIHLAAAPRIKGEVWLSLDEAGLFRSRDSGASFSKLASVRVARLFAFGKAAPGRRNPAVFVYGEVQGQEGIFRSDDMGVTWVRINPSGVTVGDKPKEMAGDRQVHGRVYIGTGGRGVAYGEPVQAREAATDGGSQ